MHKIYLDYAATAPIRPESMEAMIPYFTDIFGNPSSVHSPGQAAREAIETARKEIAETINAKAEEIYFTSGGTESDNWVINMIAKQKKSGHIITTAIEHPAILTPCQKLAAEGFEVTYLPVDNNGLVDPADVAQAIRADTILISVMMANNEIGTIQPIKEIGALARAHQIPFHTDAVQAYGHLPIDVGDLNVDLLSLSSHKILGPKGVGALYCRRGLRLMGLITGGAQERRHRAGTENVPGIIGFAKAATLAISELEKENSRLIALRDRLIRGLLTAIPYAQLNGHPTKRLPGNANITFRFIEGESILLQLDALGIAASSGSACTSGSLDPSHVLLAIGLPHEIAHGSIRFSLGKNSSAEEIDYVIKVLPPIIAKLREMSPLYEDFVKNEKE